MILLYIWEIFFTITNYPPPHASKNSAEVERSVRILDLYSPEHCETGALFSLRSH